MPGGTPALNASFFRDLDIGSLLNMENMNAGFIAEGLTSRKRAIAEYMKERGTPDDARALGLLKELEALVEPTYPKGLDLKAIHRRIPAIHEELVRLAGETTSDDGVSFERSLECPLAVYALARFSLHPGLGHFGILKAWWTTLMALDAGFAPARALYADLALNTRLSPRNTTVINTLKKFLHDPSEDLLLVMGRRLALWDVCGEDLASLVRQRLKEHAETGHVDAMRMLALAHSADVKPETAWAREEIAAQAKRGKAYAMLIMAQHLAGRFHFWMPEGDSMENMQKARVLLERCARQNDDWASLLLAFTYLFQEYYSGAMPVGHDAEKGLEILGKLATERDFAPAKAMIGAWRFDADMDVEAAWPHLRDACASGFSRQCEAVCADFLISVITNALYVETARNCDLPTADSFDDNDYGGADFWLSEMCKLPGIGSSGLVELAVLRLQLFRDNLLDGSFDINLATHYLASYSDGTAAIHCLLLNLAQENTDYTLELRLFFASCVVAGGARGNEDCILAGLLFMQDLLEQRSPPWPADELLHMAEGFCAASSLARMVVHVLRLLFAHDYMSMGFAFDSKAMEDELGYLVREYRTATCGMDMPIIFALPVLFKYASRHFKPNVVRRTLEEVSLALHGERTDLPGFLNGIRRLSGIQGLDMDRLWENLGLVRGSDFRPAPSADRSLSEERRNERAAAKRKARRKQAQKSRKKR